MGSGENIVEPGVLFNTTILNVYKIFEKSSEKALDIIDAVPFAYRSHTRPNQMMVDWRWAASEQNPSNMFVRLPLHYHGVTHPLLSDMTKEATKLFQGVVAQQYCSPSLAGSTIA